MTGNQVKGKSFRGALRYNLEKVEKDVAEIRIKDGGKLFDIAVLDHLIVTKDGYYSFADDGRI